MGLSYYYRFTASRQVEPQVLEKFLKSVEAEAKTMGFQPTDVLNVRFDTSAQKEFARRLTSGYPMDDQSLQGVSLLKKELVWDYNQQSGSCRIIPQMAVVLVMHAS